MSWFTTAIDALVDGRDQGCEVGHKRHTTMTTPWATFEDQGEMTVFEPFKYQRTEPGYCPGNDCVSRTIVNYGMWEPTETRLFIEALHRSPGIVIDFGSQIGWYTMIATRMGHTVLAIEGVSEHMKITKANADVGVLWQAHHWVCDTTPTLSAEGAPPVALVKIDLEGSEVHAIRCVQALIDAGLVVNILMEVSPIFNDTYPALVGHLLKCGYSAIVCTPEQPPVTLDNYEEVIALAPQVDMLFTRGL